MAVIKYIPFFLVYDAPQMIPSNCNSITFINLGQSVAYIEGTPIQPNQSISIEGNACEFTDYNFKLTFDNSGQNNLTVIKKVYIS